MRTNVLMMLMAATASVGIARAEPAGALLPLATTKATTERTATRVADQRLVITPNGGGAARVVFDAPHKRWNLAGQSVVATVKNTGEKPATVRLRLENADANNLADACQMAAVLLPGEEKPIRVRAIARPQDPTYAPFEPFMMYFKNITVRDNTVDPTAIARVVIEIDRPEPGTTIEVASLIVEGEQETNYTPPPFLPFIDAYGQYIHSDWPGKIKDDADFDAQRAIEDKERADWPGPSDWNEYGGWAKGPTLEATGFFRVQKHDGKWWFVDPTGKLYWSNGPTGVGFGGDVTPITDREHWFKELPVRDGPWGSFYRDGRNATYRYYSNRAWTGYDIARANLVRKYGPDYQKIVPQVSHERLRSWGFNTVGNWSAREVCELQKTPYTIPIGSPYTHTMRWSDGHSFQDVYDPRWEPGLYESMERERGRSAGDPWCIGYFVDNERCIGWRPRAAAVGEITLQAPPNQPAKAKLIERLRTKYESVDKLNAAWKTTYASWEAIRDTREAPSLRNRDNDPIMADLGDFGMAFCERYFSVSRAAVKSVAPNQLFLGSRLYGHTDPAVVELAAKYWDVISYNIYDNPPVGRVNQYNKLDVPILSTEWGVGSDPTQTPFRGENMNIDPATRVREITQYLEQSLRHPNMIGAHFFQYRDQPLSGRPDGEATLRGYVNIVDTPNFELVQANRRVGYRLYEIRAGAK